MKGKRMIVKEENGRTVAEPETQAEKLALEYLAAHRPFFAVAEQPMVTAFIAGRESVAREKNTIESELQGAVLSLNAALQGRMDKATKTEIVVALEAVKVALSQARKANLQAIKQATN